MSVRTTFEQLGVDRLFVDESHFYKNLFLTTKMRNVAGLSTSEAQKSSDMFGKCRYLDEITGGRGVVFATGTPVSNSMTELYTVMRYLQYSTLQQKKLTHFDCWASTFGETTTAIELAPEGTGYRARTRFAKFFNLPELMSIHSSKLIYPREIYQRGVERKRVELIARDFNEYIVNEPKVSFRNGRYYVMDGQHTIEGCILLNGGEDRPILCKVYTGLTMEQEALLFAEQNGHAAPLSAGIKLRAKVVGGDAPSKAFVAATNRAGLSLNYDSMQLSDYRIGCVGTALKLYDQLGEEIYCEALRHIVEAWEGKPDSFRAAVLRGVMYFVQLYHGQYSEERLVRALSGVHPMELYRVSRDNPAKLPGWRRYVYPIYTTYNGKCRKDALPMKF